MGWQDNQLVDLTTPAPEPPKPRWAEAPLVDAPAVREAAGPVESFQAGLQASAPGLAWRGKLPDLVSNPEHSKWWERALTGIAQVGAELPLMAVGAAAGAPAGTAVAGPVGGILGAGAGMFAVPGAIRETLIQSYKSGEIKTVADFWNILREVAITTAKEGVIGAATMGAGSIAARVAGKAIAPAITESLSVPTATKAIGTADVAAQIGTMTTMPAAFQGRLPDLQEIMDAAIVIGGLKGAHVAAERITNSFVKTGKTPAEQVADAQADPKIAEEIAKPAEAESKSSFETGVVSEPLRIQESLFVETSRLDALERKAEGTPDRQVPGPDGQPLTIPGEPKQYLTDGEKSTMEALRARVAELEASLATAQQHEASAGRVYDDVLAQVRAADQARQAAGIAPLGDDHALAVAALVRARVRTRAARLGVLPEEIYNERPLAIRDEAAVESAAAAAEIPAEAPRFAPPEVDMFGDPIPATNVPRFGIEGMATQEVPLETLALSKEVPQFKAQANAQGIVSPLGGKFDRTGVGPIQVWERLDGSMEVISGRHRFDLAKRSGETTIPAQLHREADGFDARQAATLDAKLNIREEQGSVSDYAQYFKDAGISKETAELEGLLGRAKGRAGFAIARDASPDVLAAHSAGLLSDEAALSISQAAPGIDRLQALGISVINDGKSILFATNMMRSVQVMGAERAAAGQQGDIFGFDDSAMLEASAMAKKASARQRAISEQIAAVSGASKRPEIARKMGVDVQDPAAVQLKIVELRQEQYQWDNWPLYPELVAKLRELQQDPIDFELKAETPAELKARDEEAAAAAKRKLAQEAAADRAASGKKVTVDQVDLFNTQGTLFQERRSEPRDLIVRHNLTEANLLHAHRMGGIPVPSLAINRLSQPFEGFGEITLVGDKAMGDPRGYAGTRVFGADAYSPRYPTIHYKVDAQAERTVSDLWKRYEGQTGDRYFDLDSLQKEGVRYLRQEAPVMAAFLDEQGIRVDPARHAEARPGQVKGEIDRMGTRHRLQNAIQEAKLDDDFYAYADRLFDSLNLGERIFRGFTNAGNKSYKPHTLENVVAILKKELRGGENFNYGVGSLRAKFTPQFRSVEGIRAAKGRLLGKDEFEAVKKEIDGDLSEIWNDIAPYSDRGKEIGFGDTVIAVLEDSGRMGVTRALAEYGIKDVPDQTKMKMAEFLTRLRNLPTEYFEAKILREVDLAEFRGAVVPDTTGPKALEILKARGLDVETYKKGDAEDRQRAVKAITDRNADSTLFQEHRGAYEIANNLITTMAGADKSTVVHELGHSWLEEMKLDAKRKDAPEQLKADWEILRRELAIGEGGEIGRASHEQFARSVERYLAEGQAPSVELRSVFQRFRDWLLALYDDLRNLNVTINPELRATLDRMLATDEEIAAARDLGVPRAYVAEAKANEARKIVPGFKAEQISMQPFADELPKGPGEAPDSSHVNYAYINTPLDVKLTMQRMAEIDQANIQKQRGGTDGVKSWAEANAEQARYVNDILGGGEDTLHLFEPRDPDAPHVDVRLGILKKLAVGAAADSARLRDVVLAKGHDATVREQLEYMGSIERARMIQAEFLGERASVARALNALKDVTEGTGEIARMLDVIGYGEEVGRLFQDVRSPAEEQSYLAARLAEILQNYKGKSVLDIAKLHKEIGTLKGAYKFSKAMTQATKWEMVVEGWRAGLLSGPVTHTTNLFGTGAFQAIRAPVDALASIIGMARGASPGMGESDRASMSEAVARLSGMLGGVQDGVKVAIATFKLDDPTGKTEAYRTAIPGRAGEVIRIPLRLMGAEDALVSTMYRRGEMKTLAIRQAFDEGMNPATREFAERVDALMDKPTAEMDLAADAAATRMTFNMPLGEKGVALQQFVSKWNLQWMIPFIRTPINIAKELLRMSPFAPAIGEWRAAIAKGGVERDRAIAEITLGTGIMATTMAYAFAGNISGAGSPDPGKNRGKVGVWQPYSILVGDTWYEYARIQPTGTLMGMAADVANIWDHMTDEEKDKVPKMMAVAFSNAITNQTFLQGITSFVNAVSDPTRFGPKYMQQLAGSLVPNIIGQPTTMADPVVREVNSMLEAIQARIPGLRQDLLPKRDWLGEPIKTKERMGVVLPSREQPVSDDKVRLEAARLDISMADAPKKTHIGKGTGKLGDVELTPEERNTFAKVGGEFAHNILTSIVNAPGYDAIPDLVKRNIFSKVLTASHKVAAVAAMPMDKRLAYIQTISEKVTEALQPEEQ